MSGSAAASDVYRSTPALAGRLFESAPPEPKYHVCAAVPWIGQVENERSNAGYGSPGVVLPVGAVPAPLSNRTRTDGWLWNRFRAAS